MTQNDDTISRQAAIDLVRDVCNAVMSGCNSHYDSEVGDEVYDDILEVNAILTCNKEVRKALKGMPFAQQDCIECEEYDHKTKSCPRYCDVIQRTLEEAKQKRTGRWIIKDNPGTGWYRITCSECGEDVTSTAPCIGFYPNAKVMWNYCPDCGARMEVDDATD